MCILNSVSHAELHADSTLDDSARAEVGRVVDAHK